MGIGTTTPNATLQVYGTAASTGLSSNPNLQINSAGTSIQVDLGAYTGGYGFIQTKNSSNAAQPLLINPNGGKVSIGTTTSSTTLTVVQSANSVAGGFSLFSSDIGSANKSVGIYMDSTGALNFAANGLTATLNAAGAWTNASDLAYKTNITDLSKKYGLNTVLSTEPRYYTMKATGIPQVGFIAEELQPVLPEVVSGTAGGESVSYSNLVAVAFQAIKDMNSVMDVSQAINSSSTQEHSALFVSPTGDVSVYHNLFANTATFSGGYDLAEQYNSTDASIGPGDVVKVDTINAQSVVKTSQPSDTAIGIISTNPSIVLGSTTGSGIMERVALAGRVPVKVNMQNGPIAIGDFLTPSSVAGVAMKATNSGNMIGTALQAFNNSSATSSTIMAFVKPGYEAVIGPDETTATSTWMAQIVTAVQTQFEQMALITQTLTATTINAVSGVFGSVHTDNLVVGSASKPAGITLYDEATGIPYCLQIANGAMETTQGICADTPAAPSVYTAPISTSNTPATSTNTNTNTNNTPSNTASTTSISTSVGSGTTSATSTSPDTTVSTSTAPTTPIATSTPATTTATATTTTITTVVTASTSPSTGTSSSAPVTTVTSTATSTQTTNTAPTTTPTPSPTNTPTPAPVTSSSSNGSSSTSTPTGSN